MTGAFIDNSFKGLKNLPIDVMVILGVSKYVDSCGSGAENSEEYAAANAASYAKELIRGVVADDLTNSIPNLKGTEIIVPPHPDLRLPQFESHQYPSYGNVVLLVIPTENESKGRLLREAFREQTPEGVIVHSITIPFDSGVGEQPYNEAGIIGAHNRISNALCYLDAPEHQDIFELKGIGTVIVTSIESYIQIQNVDRPTDYGVVAMHNATTKQTMTCLSWGATVPSGYVNRARHFGFDGDPNHGRVTVGQILAAHVPGVDKADWQMVLTRHSRYDLLKDAIGRLPIPW